ncbi:polysaccharide deacetylase family protein [Numidum massiliense]|uniref:polysaccharide deacetylase family protein n=1 Tax=Numidum massiliense TaxID=1522315 RepID=UPI0006D59893|nr:polysaccharide deacetylase family protein [Numidum massiliense]
MSRLQVKLVILAVSGVAVALLLTTFSPLTAYIDGVKHGQAVPVMSSQPTAGGETKMSDSLEQLVKKAAKEHSEPPIDARVDSVWKAIPGYNGLVVDESRTLALARDRGSSKPPKLVYREVPPKVQLKHLPPNPIYRGNEHKPMVALMINVAWGTEHIAPMLAILEREDVRATFFFDGSWLAKHADTAKQIVAAGHAVGNHAYHHPLMSRLSTDKMRQEMSATSELIKQSLGVETPFFAPPAGDFNDRVVQTAADLGMYTVLWTADTVDWKPSTTPQRMVERIRRDLGNGTLILMHPTDRTVEALPQIIQTVQQNGLTLGTVEEVLSEERIPRIEPQNLF